MTDELEEALKFNEGIEKYNEERGKDDADLVGIVRDILVEAGLNKRLTYTYDQDKYILEAMDKTPVVQRFLLNRYWTQQLIMTGKDVVDERYTLIPNGDLREWLQLFKSSIVPFILDNDLPVVVQ